MHYTGTEKFVLQTATMMQKFGNKVKVITYSFYEDSFYDRSMGNILLKEFSFKGIPVLAFKYKKAPLDLSYGIENKDLSKIADELITKEKPDIVHVGHPMRVHELIRPLKTFGIPCVLTLTDFWLMCPKGILTNSRNDLCGGPKGGAICRDFCPEFSEKFIINRLNVARDIIVNAKLIVSPSKFVASMFKKEFIESRIKVINHGISYSKIKKNNKNYKKEDKLIFCYAGSLNDHKGIHILIDAFKRIKSNNATLKIFGSGSNPLYVNSLFDMAKEDKRIEFCGVYSEDQVGNIFSNVDVVIVPSLWYENYPLVLHEALAGNVPVIASNAGGMAEKIKDGINGFSFPVGDVKALKTIIGRIITTPEILNNLKENIKGSSIPTIEQEAYAYHRIYKSMKQ